MTIKFAIADICTAFAATDVIGSKVQDPGAFIVMLENAVEDYDDYWDRVPGQHFVTLPAVAAETVSCGVGRRTMDPNDYVARTYREGVSLFLKREKAAETESVSVVVYTREAYLGDPDMTVREASRIARAYPNYTHVIVAVLAGGGPDLVVSPYRFVHNLAGGNHEYDLARLVTQSVGSVGEWDADSLADTEVKAWEAHFTTLVEKAKAVKAYADDWCTVAD